MLVGARRLAAAAIHGGASRSTGLSYPRDRGRSFISGCPCHVPLRTASSDAAGHVDTTPPPTEVPPKPLPFRFALNMLEDIRKASIAATGVPCSQSENIAGIRSAPRDGQRDFVACSAATSANARGLQGPPPKPAPRTTMSSLFTSSAVRHGRGDFIAGSAASGVGYSTSANTGGLRTTCSRQEGPPLAEAPPERQSLSSIFTKIPRRCSENNTSDTKVPQRLPLAMSDQESAINGSLSSLFAGRQLPRPFRPPCPHSPLPFLNEAAPTSEVLHPLACFDDSFPELFNLEQIFDPVNFVKKYPLMVHVHPLFAQDSEYDRWMYTEIAKELARSLPKTITQAHSKGLSFEKFGSKDLLVAANLSDPDDISARFLIRVATKTATPESMEEDLRNSGLALKELMEVSVGSSDFWSNLADDVRDFVHHLENPLDVTQRYLTVNHACLFPLAAMSQAYIICFELLLRGRLPREELELILEELPDLDGKWKKIAAKHPLLEKMLKEHRTYDGDLEYIQLEYRRNVVIHKTKFGDDYPPSAVDIILQLYFPGFMVSLLRALMQHNKLLPLKLHRLFRR